MCSTREYQWMQSICEHFSHSFVRVQIKKSFFGRWKIQFVRYFCFKNNIFSFPLNICLCVESREKNWMKKLLLNSELLLEKYFSNISLSVKWLHVWRNDWSWLSWNTFFIKCFSHICKENEKEKFQVLSIDYFFLYKQFIYEEGWNT